MVEPFQEIAIFDLFGKLWINTIEANGKINIAALPPGMYQLRIIEMESYQIIPFVKQ